MTEGPPRSAGVRWRPVALVAAFCALAVGPGCNRETFDLLDVAGNTQLAGSAGTLQGGAGTSGAPAMVAGGGSGNAGEGGAGRAGVSHGGTSGGFGFGQGGFAAAGPGCLPGQPCPSGPLFCDSEKDCAAYTDSPHCSTAIGWCVQCRSNENDCGVDEVCPPVTLRCAHRCQTSVDCANDFAHGICDSQYSACVACTKNSNCPLVDGRQNYCVLDSCVECTQSNMDAVTPAAAQCPVDKPYCVRSHCQASRLH